MNQEKFKKSEENKGLNQKEVERLLGTDTANVYELLTEGVTSLRQQLDSGGIDEKHQQKLTSQLSEWEIYRRGLRDIINIE